MSCVHFGAVPSGDGPALAHSSPEKTQGKIDRLVSMINSDDVKIRAAAAGNPMLPQGWMFALAKDDEFEVRSWVARNPNCHRAILEFMAEKDSEKSLREFAKYRISMIESKNNNAG